MATPLMNGTVPQALEASPPEVREILHAAASGDTERELRTELVDMRSQPTGRRRLAANGERRCAGAKPHLLVPADQKNQKRFYVGSKCTTVSSWRAATYIELSARRSFPLL